MVLSMARSYEEVKKEAQARANLLGSDQGIEYNKIFKEYTTFGLPMAKHRCGHELRCEVVHPDNLEKTAPGHGYKETRKAPCGWHGAPALYVGS
jgi:hypothetical protein